MQDGRTGRARTWRATGERATRILGAVALLALLASCSGYDCKTPGTTPAADVPVAADVPHAPDVVAGDTAVPVDAVTSHDLAPDVAPARDVAPDAAADVPAAVDATPDAPPPPAPAAAADPFIGSGVDVFNVGNAFPGACAPFGMVKVSPDTADSGGEQPVPFHCAGYRYQDRYVLGFTHMHLYGTGAPDYANILFMPTVGMDATKTAATGYRSEFDRAGQEAHPGYYGVTLTTNNIHAELTATEHTAYHRYTFPAGAEQIVLVDMAATAIGGHSGGGVVDIDVAGQHVSGWMLNVGAFSGRYGGFKVYFDARFDRPFARHGTWLDGTLSEDATHGEGVNLGLYLGFDAAQGATVEAQVGISVVSVESARANREAELPSWGFDGVRAATAAQWATGVGRVAIDGTSADERTIFYTALYHVMMMPTLFTDTDGRYVGIDQQVHTADGFRYYTDFSGWDTFRTFHPLVDLLLPDRAADMVQSLAHMAAQVGMPRWPMGAGETGSMLGTPCDCIVADAYVKGIRNFDVDAAYTSMHYKALNPPPSGQSGRDHIDEYLSYGYIPADHMEESVSHTLEFAYEDFCLANLAAALGHTEDAATFRAHSANYRNLWDGDTQFFRPRNADGSWLTPFTPTAYSKDYTEATAWQYSWFVPHDVPGLIQLFGSPEAMVAKLNLLFDNARKAFQFTVPTFYYYQGNEPSLQAAYMFLEAGRPDLTQRWVRWVLATNYETGPNGLIGNDDAGTLSAWYVFSALGFFPLPGSTRYYVGSPMVKRAVVHLAGGDLTVTAPANSPDNIYVSQVRLNGAPLAQPWFDHADIVNGGTLEFDMSPTPVLPAR